MIGSPPLEQNFATLQVDLLKDAISNPGKALGYPIGAQVALHSLSLDNNSPFTFTEHLKLMEI